MAQDILSIRMDKDLKRELGQFCEKVGLSISSVINMYARKVVDEQKIPFEISVKKQPDRLGYIKAIESLKDEVVKKYPNELDLEKVNIIFDEAKKTYLDEKEVFGIKANSKEELLDRLEAIIALESIRDDASNNYPNGISMDEINKAIDEVRRSRK